MNGPRDAPLEVPHSASRVAFAGTLSLAMAMAGSMQFVLGVLGPFLREDLRLSTQRLGLLVTAFFVAAAVLSLPAGRLTDRLGGRRVLCGLFAVDVVAFAGMAVATSYALMLVFAGLAGATMSAANPATNRLVAAYVPAQRRGVVIGVKQSGIQVGAFAVGAFMPLTAHVLGWRGAIAGCGVIAMVGLLAAAVVLPSGRRPRPRSPSPSTGRQGRELAWLVGFGLLMGAGFASVLAYLPVYAVDEVHLSRVWAGQLVALLGGVAIVSRVLWARGVARVRHLATPLAVVAGSAVVADALIVLGGSHGTWLLWVGAALFGAGAAAWLAIAMLSLVRGRPQDSTGQVSGVVSAGYYAGLLASPGIFSVFTREGSSYAPGWVFTGAMFASAFLLALLWRRSGHPQTPPPVQLSE